MATQFKKIVHYRDDLPPSASTRDVFQGVGSNPGGKVVTYLKSLFPIFQWVFRYNLTWATGDIIAGLTVGLVIVPQGMSYAIIATLSPEYGLYSSFVGVLFYCLFATSKDVSIGPVAVMSLTVAEIIRSVENSHPGEFLKTEIATALAFLCGFIALGIGILRLGWLVEFISAPAVAGFMTGSAISICSGQVAGLLGISGVNTRAETYKVIINTLKGLPRAKMDAAFGVTGLVSLYLIRFLCEYAGKRFPRRARVFFFLSVLRNAFVIIVLTLSAYLYCRGAENKKYPIKILKTVPPGFQHVKPPTINSRLVSALGPELPLATIILVLEHVAIAKSFGRLNGYKINPNQELIAIGVTNTIGSVFGSYPATGSFSRTALKSKSGVRTPAAGIVTALIVIVALYGLTPAFYWIPSAGLSAVIIHAVADLVATPAQVYQFWRVSPLEFFIWLAAVLVTIFSSIENGIYTSIAASLALLLIRVARPRGTFLGKVTVRGDSSETTREVYLPFKPKKGGYVNSDVEITAPPAGILIYRHEESLVYPNSSIANSALVDKVKEEMRRGKDMTGVKASDRPWNDPGPSKGSAHNEQELNLAKPDLFAVVLDFSGISQIDTTATQDLVDARAEIERWADHPVEFHFATILSPWIRRALIAGGFGTGTPLSNTRDISSVVPHRNGFVADDEESKGHGTHVAPADTPFFHIDLSSAVRAAEEGLTRRSQQSSGSSIKGSGSV